MAPAALPLELRYITQLYLAKHYRRCAQECRDLLDATQAAPSHIKLFANFYLALAHDDLARLMLELSPATIPCFNQAEQFYQEAARALLAIEEQYQLEHVTPRCGQDPFVEDLNAPQSIRTPQQIAHDSYYQFASPRSSLQRQSLQKCVSISTCRQISNHTGDSDLTDIESHSSFNQILTPSKITHVEIFRASTELPSSSDAQPVLQRDYSSMSLLDTSPPRKPSGLPRTTSTISSIRQIPVAENVDTREQYMSLPRPISRPPSVQQSLLKPIRMGSPVKVYEPPTRLPQLSGNSLSRKSVLPKLKTGDMHKNSLRPRPSSSESTSTEAGWSEVSPVSPVSPLGCEGDMSEITAISPISPATSPQHSFSDEPLPFVAEEVDEEVTQQVVERPIRNQNIEALGRQLHCHLAMLAKMKRRTQAIQAVPAARAADSPQALTSPALLSRPSSSSSSKHDSVMSAENKSFTPKTESLRLMEQDTDTAEQRRKRIEAGRARKWQRPRFDAKRYIDLADQALAEL